MVKPEIHAPAPGPPRRVLMAASLHTRQRPNRPSVIQGNTATMIQGNRSAAQYHNARYEIFMYGIPVRLEATNRFSP